LKAFFCTIANIQKNDIFLVLPTQNPVVSIFEGHYPRTDLIGTVVGVASPVPWEYSTLKVWHHHQVAAIVTTEHGGIVV
jgi:hypothetical protein